MVDFTKALNTKLADVEQPKQLPPGTYTVVVAKTPTIDKRGKDPVYDLIEFELKVQSPGEDVDPELLQAFGGIKQNTHVRYSFMFNSADENAMDGAMFRLKKFISDSLRMENFESMTLKAALDNCIGLSCLAVVQWRPRKNEPEIMDVNVTKTLPIS